jgi:hypothetical protein
VQDIKNVELWDGDDDEPRHVIINTEWGAFGANGELDFIRTKWDMAGTQVLGRHKQHEKRERGKRLVWIGVHSIIISLFAFI